MTDKRNRSDQVRNVIRKISKYCIGCTVYKSEGPRHYSELAPEINNHCTICLKLRYKDEV